jgi:hypothetical protein
VLSAPFVPPILAYFDQRLDFSLDPVNKHRTLKRFFNCLETLGSIRNASLSKEDNTVSGGGFSEVHRGYYNEKHIAAKVLKVFQNSDIDQVLKVALQCPIFVSLS